MVLPNNWNVYTEHFFEQEIDRLLVNAKLLFESLNIIGENRKKSINYNQWKLLKFKFLKHL